MGIWTSYTQIDDYLKAQYPKVFDALFPNAKKKADKPYFGYGPQ
jgi:hypothetical protein